MSGNEVKIVQSKAYVRVETKRGRSDAEILKDVEVVFQPEEFNGVPEVVSVSSGLTMNLGNFESARLDVFRSMPLVPGRENADAAFEVCKKWVGDRIQKEVAEIRGHGVLDKKSIFNEQDVIGK